MKQQFFRLLWLLPSVVLVAFDQWTKYVAKTSLHQPKVLIKNVLELTYAENTGAAWSMFAGKQTLLIVVTALMLGFVLWALLKGPWWHPLVQASEMLLIAGGCGNLIDRVFRDYVVDFIYVSAIHFPVFNAADCFVCCGAAILILYVLFFEKGDSRGNKASAAGNNGGGAAGQNGGAESLGDKGDGTKVD